MDRPNVLLICVDRWPGRPNHSLAEPTILTPTLDQLAESGIVFTNAYSTTPSCIPARRELHTGTFPRTHGDRVFNETLRPNVAMGAVIIVAAGLFTLWRERVKR